MDHPKDAKKGSRLPEVTKRMILMITEENPEYGCRKISDLLARGPEVPASESAVATFLKEHGYECVDVPTEPHPDKQRRFERAKPGQLWQTDLFTFTMRRMGVRQIVSRPRHPQTFGKIERVPLRGSGAPCGVISSSPPSSWIWRMPVGGSASSSTTITSSARTRRSTDWRLPTAFSVWHQKSWQR